MRLCTGSLGDVGGFLEPAQHRDRIRLGGSKQPEPVDVLVISDPSVDWVAFRHRDLASCGDESSAATEPVDVYIITEEDKEFYAEWSSYVLSDGSADVPSLPQSPVARLQYPLRAWALPAGTEAVQLTDDLFELVGTKRATAVALVATSDRRALGVARAGLLATHITVGRSRNAVLRADVWTDDPESIVVLAPEPSGPVHEPERRGAERPPRPLPPGAAGQPGGCPDSGSGPPASTWAVATLARTPAWANRRRLLRGRERLSDQAFVRLWEQITAHEPTGQLLAAWIAKEELRISRATWSPPASIPARRAAFHSFRRPYTE